MQPAHQLRSAKCLNNHLRSEMIEKAKRKGSWRRNAPPVIANHGPPRARAPRGLCRHTTQLTRRCQLIKNWAPPCTGRARSHTYTWVYKVAGWWWWCKNTNLVRRSKITSVTSPLASSDGIFGRDYTPMEIIICWLACAALKLLHAQSHMLESPK